MQEKQVIRVEKAIKEIRELAEQLGKFDSDGRQKLLAQLVPLERLAQLAIREYRLAKANSDLCMLKDLLEASNSQDET